MKAWRGIILGSCLLLLAACSGIDSFSEVRALKEAKPVGSPFTQHLAAEYRDFATNELDNMFDYPDALHFARKGLAAAAGEVVMPEPLSDWNLAGEDMEALGAARARLLGAFDRGARDTAPQQAANAQAMFDCWIEQEEEIWQSADVLGCREKYLSSVETLESMIEKTETSEEPEPAPELMPVMEVVGAPEAVPMTPEDSMYLVFFVFDKSNISEGARDVLETVYEESMRMMRDGEEKTVKIIGHTDSSGPNDYNDRLAMRRANAARDALTQLGVDPAAIRVEGRGEDELLVKTADGVREPANRRAEITFE